MNCINCGVETIGRNKRCVACKREKHRIAIANYRANKGIIKSPGVGSGNNQRGKSNHQYKHGGYTYETLRQSVKTTRRYCNRCNKDLLEAGHYEWVIHHIDHDHSNNPDDGSNWELLCKRCHQVEHECHMAFSKVQRPSRKGVASEDTGEAHSSAPQADDDMV